MQDWAVTATQRQVQQGAWHASATCRIVQHECTKLAWQVTEQRSGIGGDQGPNAELGSAQADGSKPVCGA